MITALKSICNKFSGRQENGPHHGHNRWSQTLPKKRNLQRCKNFLTIWLMCHLSKVTVEEIVKKTESLIEEVSVYKKTFLHRKIYTTKLNGIG